MAAIGPDTLSKHAARERGRQVRAAMPAGQRELLDQKIAGHCHDMLDWEAYRRVHVFLPIARLLEIDIWPLMAWLWRRHPEIWVYVPRVIGGETEHVRVTEDTGFAPNAYGVPEPVAGDVLPAGTQLDLILVPLLAFDQDGHRVGYGGGYYDRFLAGQPGAFLVGLAYTGCMMAEGIAAEAHDIPLDAVITEQGLIRIGSDKQKSAGGRDLLEADE